MSFGFFSFRLFWPFIVLLVLVPLALVVWKWMRSGRTIVVPFDHGRTGRGLLLRSVLNLADSIPALTLLVVVLLLAGPTRLLEPKTQKSLTNIEFCVDISGSMMASFGQGTRYDASMAAIDEFVKARKGDAFGLTFFGNSVMHWTPITTDPSAILCATPYMRPEVAPPHFGGTEIGRALLACRERLNQVEKGDKMLLLVSDGMSADLGGGRDQEVAGLLKQDGIVVYAIHIGGGNVPDQIINITSITGGEAFAPEDVGTMAKVFKNIDSMQQAELERMVAESVDFYEPFIAATLSLVAIGLVCSFGLRYTPW
jgi:Ca-activated chloride channel family protein